MKVSSNWIKELVPHTLSPQDLAEALTLAGLEVESVDPIAEQLSGIITATITEINPHPNADKGYQNGDRHVLIPSISRPDP